MYRIYLLLFFLLSTNFFKAQVVVANFTASPLTICAGQTVQFTDLSTGNPTTWNWTFPGGSPATSTLQNPVITYTLAGSYNVVLSASNGGLPSVVTTFNYITVLSAPVTPGAISGPISLCAGQQGTYSVIAVTGAVSYSWSPPSNATLVSGQGTNSIVLIPGPGVATLCVRGGNGCGYGQPSCLVLTGLLTPSISVTPSNTTICGNASVALMASGAIGYSWSPSTGLNTTIGASVVASPTASTKYTVTGVGATSCTSAAVATVNVVAPVQLTVTPSSTVICTGGSVTLTATGASSFVWTPGTGLSGTTGSIVVASPTSNITYTVSDANSQNCSNKGIASITVTPSSPGAAGVIAGSPLACAGLTNTYVVVPVTNASTYSWTVPAGATIQSGQGTATIIVISGSSSGSICVSAGNGCGYGPQSCLPVIALLPPSVTVAPTSASLCAGSSTTLVASGATAYSWSPSSGLNSTTSPTVIATPSITTLYTVTGTSSTGCTGTATVDVVVHPLPTITISPSVAIVCTGGSVTLVANGAFFYTWTPGSTLSNTTGAIVTASPIITTTYSITGSFLSGCTNTIAFTVSVATTPPSMSGSPSGPNSTCAAKPVTYTVSSAPGVASYSWSVPTGASIQSGQGTNTATIIFGSNSGNVCVSGINGCGTGAATCFSVSVLPVPVVSVVPTTATLCAGTFTTLIASGASSYSWSPASAVSDPTSAAPGIVPFNSTTYSVVGTGTNGCSNTKTVLVTVIQLPVVKVTPSSAFICAPGMASMIASGAQSYSWEPPTGLSSTNSATVFAGPVSTTIYTVTGSTLGCTNAAVATVSVSNSPPPPIGSIDGPTISCPGEIVTFSVAGVFSAVSYNWILPVGSAIVSGQNTNIVGVLIGPNQGNICVSPVNGCGGGQTTCMFTNVRLSPLVSATATSACNNGTIQMAAEGAVSYTWSPPTGLNTTNGPTVVTTTQNIYTVVGTGTNGCLGITTVAAVFVPPTPAPVINGALTHCEGSEAQYQIIPHVSSSYTWTLTQGLHERSHTNSIITLTVVSPGTLCISGSNACGSTSLVCRSIGVRPVPTIAIVGGTFVNCSNSPTLSALVLPLNSPVSWAGPDNFAATGTLITASAPGKYEATVTNTTSVCDIIASVSVTGHLSVDPFDIILTPADCDNKNNGSIQAVGVYGTYTLYTGNTVSSPLISAGIPLDGYLSRSLPITGVDQEYYIELKDTHGCSTSTLINMVSIKCEDPLFIPEIFTPNGDNIHDMFEVSNTGGRQFKLTVFNRWGSKVYEKNNYDNTWNGESNSGGGRLPPSTYYYIMEFKSGGIKDITGFVVIQY